MIGLRRQGAFVSGLRREIALGLKNISQNGLRSLLTMLGMVFGVGSVVAMLAVGEGASRQALERIHLLGSTNIIIHARQPAVASTTGGGRTLMRMYGLLFDDLRRLHDGFPRIRRLAPVRLLAKEARVGSRTAEVRVVGTEPPWFALVRRPVLAGRPLSDLDVERRASVAVLSDKVARRLFPGGDGLGRSVRIDGNYYQVVGVVRTGDTAGGGVQLPDRQEDIYIPLSTVRERMGDIVVRRTAGSRSRELVELHAIVVQVADIADVEPVAAGIEAMLVRFHPRTDYRIQVPLALLRQAEATRRTFNLVLGAIAAISLLVGGIGIMNIMLASVTERTREIGIRRAIGARRRQIVRQFLVETTVLATAGGCLGVVLGLILPWLIQVFSGMPTVVTPASLGLALGISMVVGIVSGLYPAMRAAALDPMVALRHE